MEKDIIVIDNILPEDLCGQLINKYKNFESCDRTNITSWPDFIVKNSNVVLVNDLNNWETNIILNRLKNYLPQIYNEPFRAMFYRWTTGSYIPPHDDGHIDHAITIHLNQNYEEESGGLFMYRMKDSDHWTGIEPIYNRMVYTYGRVRHWTTPTHTTRLSLQLFNLRP